MFGFLELILVGITLSVFLLDNLTNGIQSIKDRFIVRLPQESTLKNSHKFITIIILVVVIIVKDIIGKIAASNLSPSHRWGRNATVFMMSFQGVTLITADEEIC